MSTRVTMPQLGESVVEGTIAKWLVREGDVVQEDQALVEVTTDKIDTEIPSPAAGVIGAIRVPEGQTVAIGTVLCEIVAAAAGATAPAGPPAPAKAAGAKPAPAVHPEGARPEPASRPAPAAAHPAPTAARGGAGQPAARPAAVPAERGPAPPAAAPAPAGPPRVRSATDRPGVALEAGRTAAAGERRRSRQLADGNGGRPGDEPRVTPVVRKMAAERQVDLARVDGTGVGGRVTKQDLLRHLGLAPGGEAPDYGDVLGLEAPAAPPPPAPASRGAKAAPLRPAESRGAAAAADAPTRGLELRDYAPPGVEAGPDDRVEPFSKRRRIIAEHMVYSKAVSPHVYTMAEVDMWRVAALRDSRKKALREQGLNLTYLHFVIAAAVRALRDVPRINAVVGDDALILRRDVNVGVAVETEGGLVVPVLRQADRLSLRGVAEAVEELAARARERKLRLEDLQGGTFTVSNPGREGNLVGFAIINQPQLGILRMGEIKKRPVVVELDGADAIAIRPMMLLSLSYDHRVIDGVAGNRFLYRVKEHLEAGEFDV